MVLLHVVFGLFDKLLASLEFKLIVMLIKFLLDIILAALLSIDFTATTDSNTERKSESFFTGCT